MHDPSPPAAGTHAHTALASSPALAPPAVLESRLLMSVVLSRPVRSVRALGSRSRPSTRPAVKQRLFIAEALIAGLQKCELGKRQSPLPLPPWSPADRDWVGQETVTVYTQMLLLKPEANL